MSSSSSPFSSLSFKQSIALTAVLASLVTSTAILSYQSIRREARTESLKRQVARDVDEWEREHDLSTPEEEVESFNAASSGKKERQFKAGEYDESLIREQVSGGERL